MAAMAAGILPLRLDEGRALARRDRDVSDGGEDC
jgi:hypothetical protein